VPVRAKEFDCAGHQARATFSGRAVGIMSTAHQTGTPSTGWGSLAQFAGVILLVDGLFGVMQGLVALVGPDTYYAVLDGDLFLFDVQGWGWLNLIFGVFLLLAAFALFAGATWARVVAVALAVINAVIQLLLVPVQPWWSFIAIALDVLIIYALVAHGGQLKSKR
jgi:membrane protein insertase Oxa1/YidC/SpoIIIJ